MKIHPMTGCPAAGGREVQVRSGGSTGRVGSFGMTRDGGTKMHKGTDFVCSAGAPVFATLDGVVIRSGESLPRNNVQQDGRKGYGYRVYIKHNVTGDGRKIETRYAHLSTIFVREHQSVRGGECIGLAGRSGNADDPHLHYEVRTNGNAVNPEDWLT